MRNYPFSHSIQFSFIILAIMVLQKKSPKAKKARDLHKAPNYCPSGRVTRLERTYACRRKQDVLLFLVHYRIPLKKTSLNNYRAPNRVLAGLPEFESYKNTIRLTPKHPNHRPS
jgi:hypothetical protein